MKKKQTRMTDRRFRELERISEFNKKLTSAQCLKECLDEIQALKDDIKRLESAHEAQVKEMEWP